MCIYASVHSIAKRIRWAFGAATLAFALASGALGLEAAVFAAWAALPNPRPWSSCRSFIVVFYAYMTLNN